MPNLLPSFWKWTRPEDAERLASALQEVEPPPGWSHRATRIALVDAGLGPPWAAWALRIADAFGLQDTAACTALAIAAMTLEPGRDAPDRLVCWGWGARLLARLPGVATASFHDWLWSLALETPDELVGRPPASGGAAPPPATRCGAWKLALALGAPAQMSGRDLTPWIALATASAPLIAILASFERLWLDPSGRDIRDAAWSEWVAIAIAASPPPVLLAFAGDRSSAPRREEVRAALERRDVDEAVQARWSAALSAARLALSPETASLGEELLGALEATFSSACAYLWVRSFTAPPAPTSGLVRPWSIEQLPLDITRALERVERDPGWTSSIDVQRWGVAPLEGDLVADWFPRGLVELALDETAGGRAPRIRALLEEIPPGELRYYRGFRGIPPDADSLGLMLQLAARLPDPPLDRLESWLALLPHNLGPDGVPNVWLRRSANGATHEPPDLEWAGDRCTACLLRLLLGLLSWSPDSPVRDGHQGMINTLLAHALRCLGEGGFDGCHHYIPEYAVHLLFRVAARLDAGPVLGQRDRLAERILATQRLDGSWGSPQRTAWMLEALCFVECNRSAIERGARYLAETQRGDGAWGSEVVYYTVGKPAFMVEYRGVEVTTAMCARALHAAYHALG
ncbi:hypothetical protein WME91_39545 [Sorangium sp. So ce269]